MSDVQCALVEVFEFLGEERPAHVDASKIPEAKKAVAGFLKDVAAIGCELRHLKI